jgi:hypothetical protein
MAISPMQTKTWAETLEPIIQICLGWLEYDLEQKRGCPACEDYSLCLKATMQRRLKGEETRIEKAFIPDTIPSLPLMRRYEPIRITKKHISFTEQLKRKKRRKEKKLYESIGVKCL